jgi:hypothetical protein
MGYDVIPTVNVLYEFATLGQSVGLLNIRIFSREEPQDPIVRLC